MRNAILGNDLKLFDRARADFENLTMVQTFKLYAKVAREITQ